MSEKVKNNLIAIIILKDIFVKYQEYECCAYLREVERNILPIEEVRKFRDELNSL